jgi:Spy/CpxP family protein refolding chaperone
MRSLPRLTAAAAALLLAFGFAACSAGSPTAASATAPAGSRFDGGGSMFGSGNFAGGGNNGAVDSTSSTATRSGITFGSGN